MPEDIPEADDPEYRHQLVPGSGSRQHVLSKDCWCHPTVIPVEKEEAHG